MAVPNTLAYYDKQTISAVISFGIDYKGLYYKTFMARMIFTVL
jgi:hypothetical protein